MGILLGIQIFMGLFFLFFVVFPFLAPKISGIGPGWEGLEKSEWGEKKREFWGWEEEQEKWDGRGGICIKAPGFSSRADPNFQGAPKFPNFAG